MHAGNHCITGDVGNAWQRTMTTPTTAHTNEPGDVTEERPEAPRDGSPGRRQPRTNSSVSLVRSATKTAERPFAPRCGYMKTFLRVLASTLLAVLALGDGRVHAHADLTDSTPRHLEQLDKSPTVITLTFNEPVTLLDSTTLTGPEPAGYIATVAEGTVTLTPTTTLGAGDWMLSWKIVSADGHPVGGVLRFTVGTAVGPVATNTASESNGATSAGTESAEEPIAQDRALEALTWITLTTAAALLLSKRRSGVAVAALAGLFPALRVLEYVEVYREETFSIGEARSAVISMTAATLMALLALTRRSHLAVSAGLGVFALTATQSGHPLRLEPAPLYMLAHAAHLYAGMLWSAAVTATLIAPVHAEHHSRTATRAVALLVPAGAASSIALLAGGSLGAWERTLTVKLLLVGVALGIGAVSHLKLKQRVGQTTADAAGARGLRLRSAVEFGVLTLVAFSTAMLTTTSPTKFESTATATPQQVAGTTNTGDAAETGGLIEEGDANSNDAGNEAAGDEAASGGVETKGDVTQFETTVRFEDGSSASLHGIWNPETSGGRLTLHMDGGAGVEQAEYAILEADGSTVANGEFSTGTLLTAEADLPGGGAWKLRVARTAGFATTTGETTLELP